MMEHIESQGYISHSFRTFRNPRNAERLRKSRAWINLRRQLTPFFRSAIPTDLDGAGRTFAARITQLRLTDSLPSHIRSKGQLQSVPQMIVAAAIGQTRMAAEWLEHAPLARYWCAEMTVGSDEQLALVLRAISHRPVSSLGPTAKINIVQIRKILSVVRQYDDPSVAAGALFVLMDSRFVNCTGPKTASKMLKADSEHCDIAHRLFHPRSRHDDPQVTRKLALAKLIIDGKLHVSQATATAAAHYFANNVAPHFPPLSESLKAQTITA
jgi:hypothetical protein